MQFQTPHLFDSKHLFDFVFLCQGGRPGWGLGLAFLSRAPPCIARCAVAHARLAVCSARRLYPLLHIYLAPLRTQLLRLLKMQAAATSKSSSPAVVPSAASPQPKMIILSDERCSKEDHQTRTMQSLWALRAMSRDRCLMNCSHLLSGVCARHAGLGE